MQAGRQTELAGETRRCHPYVEQLDAAGELYAFHDLCRATEKARPRNPEELAALAIAYRDQILLPLELPAMSAAHQCTQMGEARELVATERQLSEAGPWQVLGAGSRRVGGYQLRKLRPLRDERLVQRYLEAHEAGEAHAYHGTVLGVTTAVFLIPPRQMLWDYTQTVYEGLMLAASRRLRLAPSARQRLIAQACKPIPAAISRILEGQVRQPASPVGDLGLNPA